MPSSANYKRNYKKEYKNYDSKPSVVKKRVNRNKARRKMIAKGKAKVGDGKDIDHKNGNTNDNSMSNLKAVKKSKNRSYPRTKNARKK